MHKCTDRHSHTLPPRLPGLRTGPEPRPGLLRSVLLIDPRAHTHIGDDAQSTEIALPLPVPYTHSGTIQHSPAVQNPIAIRPSFLTPYSPPVTVASSLWLDDGGGWPSDVETTPRMLQSNSISFTVTGCANWTLVK